MSEPTEVMSELLKVLSSMNAKLDSLVKPTKEIEPAKPERKKPGRKPGSGAKKPAPRKTVEEPDEDDDDIDENDEEPAGLGRYSGRIQPGKRPNEFEKEKPIAIPRDVLEDDKKAMAMLKSGKLKKTTGTRSKIKMLKKRCVQCQKKYDVPPGLPIPETGFKCNKCLAGE